MPVCFTTKPHLEWNGDPQCSAQADGEHACSGEAFTDTTAAALRAQFRTLLEETWQRASRIDFREFSDCPDSTANGYLRVTFTTPGIDPEPTTMAVTGAGMHATYPADLHVDWRALRDGAPSELRLVLREVGHVLGLPYEWLRPKTNGVRCSVVTPDPARGLVEPPQGLSDDDSVMNRCGDPGRGAVLSPADIIGVQSVYRRKEVGSLIGYRGRCVEPRTRSLQIGMPIIANECEYAYRCWFRSNTPNTFYANLGSGTWDRCFDAFGDVDGGAAKTPIATNVCTGSPSQNFPATNVQWTIASLCVAVVDEEPPRLELQECDDSLAQRWNFWDASGRLDWHQIQSVHNGHCVSMESGSVTHRPCAAGTLAQSIEVDTGGGLLRKEPYTWIAVSGDRIAPGVPLTASVGMSYRTAFTVTGSFKSQGQCLAILGGGDRLDPVGLEPCTPNSPLERFEFYW